MFKCKVYKLQDLLWTSGVFFGIKYSHHFRSFVSKAMTLLSAFPAKRMVTCISARKSSVQQNLPFLRAMESVSFNVTSVSTSVMWCGSCNTCEKWFRQQWSCSKTKAHTEFGLGLLHTTMQELWLYPQAILLVSLAAVALCHFHLHLLLRVLLSAAQFLGF